MEDSDSDPLLLPTDKEPLAGVSDYRGRTVYRRSSGGWRSALFVVAVEIAGSFAYFGISANLITYLTGPLGHSNASAAAAVNAWSGTASLMPLLGAFLADAYLGRYRSIILACSLYVLGYGMLTLSSTLSPACTEVAAGTLSCPKPGWPQLGFFYASLYLVALAQGADKPCGLAFAADQFDAAHPAERASRSSLFNWWFFSMAVGISVAVSVVGYVQENVGWGVGFGVPCAIVLAASAVFLLGTPTYRLVVGGRDESPFVRLARGFAAKTDPDARCVLRLLPIWASSLAYGVVYAQIMTLFNKQGRTLDRRIGTGHLELPPAALQALGPVSMLVFVPVYDRGLVPLLRRATGHHSGLTTLQRVGAGMATSLAAVSVAALVESRRLATARQHAPAMGWGWIVPQYAMMGAADVLAVVGLQELFYDQMPPGLRSLGLALYLSVMGVGGLLSGALVSAIDAVTGGSGGDSWFADDLDRGHLDYFYWLLAGISAAELALFLYFARSYKYKNHSSSSSSIRPK